MFVRCKRRGQRPALVWPDATREPRPGLPFGFGLIRFVIKTPRKDGGYGAFYAKSEVPQNFLRAPFHLRRQSTFIHLL